jgi:hypothetical protein
LKSRTSQRFREALERLPPQIRAQAREAYRLFQANPYHPGLRFKRLQVPRPVYSVRISREYRALGVREGDELIWFWIGPHAEYDKIIAKL